MLQEAATVIEFLAAIGATGAVVGIFGTLVSNAAARETRRRDRINRTFEFLEKFRASDFETSRDYVKREIEPKITPAYIEGGIIGLPPDDRRHARTVANFLSFIGDALMLSYVDERLLLHEISTPITHLWQALGPIVYCERIIRESEEVKRSGGQSIDEIKRKRYVEQWADGFEYLACRARDFTPPRAFSYGRYRWPVPISAGDEPAMPVAVTRHSTP